MIILSIKCKSGRLGQNGKLKSVPPVIVGTVGMVVTTLFNQRKRYLTACFIVS